MQREDILGEALKLLETQGIADTTLEMVAERVNRPLDTLQRFWPDKEAILYDALRYLSQQVDIWRRQLLLDETLSAEQSYWHATARFRNVSVIIVILVACSLPPVRFIPTQPILFTNWPINKNARHMILLMSY